MLVIDPILLPLLDCARLVDVTSHEMREDRHKGQCSEWVWFMLTGHLGDRINGQPILVHVKYPTVLHFDNFDSS